MNYEESKKSVILLGSGPEWQTCPYDREVWMVAKLAMMHKHKRIDRVFNMDQIDEMLTWKMEQFKTLFTKDEFMAKMNTLAVPFITSFPEERIAHTQIFPLKEINERWGLTYYTNTICFMIALALYEGYESISLYGVAQGGQLEYMKERKGVEFWLGLAAGMGVKIEILTHSNLMRNDGDKLYGYGMSADDIMKKLYGIEGEKQG